MKNVNLVLLLCLATFGARADDASPILRAEAPPLKPRTSCSWCVFGNEHVTDRLLRFAKLKPRALLEELKRAKVCVRIIDSGRKGPAGAFSWGKEAGALAPRMKEPKLAGVMGRMLCKDELPIAKGCTTLAVAADAPYSWLLLEYLHYEQAERDPNWCGLARTTWIRAQSRDVWREMRDKEWDAYLLLWNSLGKMSLELEDRIAISKGVIDEAEQRKGFDPAGQRFLDVEKPRGYLEMLESEYRKRMGKGK